MPRFLFILICVLLLTVGTSIASTITVTSTVSADIVSDETWFPVSISGNPSSVSVLTNGSSSFSAVASGSLISYYWKTNGQFASDAGRVSGSKTSTLTISSSVPADDGMQVECLISNACGSELTSAATWSVTNGITPTIESFSATPPSSTNGASVTLSWSTANDTNRFISPVIGSVNGFTSTNVVPTTNTTYTLRAENVFGFATSNITVSVVTNSASATNSTAAWSLDESASGPFVSCVGSLSLSPHGAITSVSGVVSNAVHFGGTSSDYISMADNPAISVGAGTNFSISMWIKHDTGTIGGGNTVFVIGHFGAVNDFGYGIYITSSQFVFDLAPDGTSTTYQEFTKAFTVGTGWHFLVVTYNGSQIGMSIDGAAQTTSSYSSGIFDSTADFAIGNAPNNRTAGTSFLGAIDEVSIYKRALSDSEISDRYNSGSGRRECDYQ